MPLVPFWLEVSRLAAAGLLSVGLAVGSPTMPSNQSLATDPVAAQTATVAVPSTEAAPTSPNDAPEVATVEPSATVPVESDAPSLDSTDAVAAGASNESPAAPTQKGSPPAVAKPTGDALAWSAKVSPSFTDEVRKICANLGCQPNDLMAAMAFESAETFSPSVENKYSGATGLIQFMPDTAQQLGTSTAELAEMTPESQLAYVAAYFAPFRGRLATVEDVYMAILWPRAVGKPADEPLFVEGGPQYAQNFYLDLDGDGIVTKHEASSHVTMKLEKGQRPEYLLAPVG